MSHNLLSLLSKYLLNVETEIEQNKVKSLVISKYLYVSFTYI